MATFDDVRAIAAALPDTTEDDRAWRVHGKLFAWDRPLRQGDRAALGDAAPKGDILAVRVDGLTAKDALLSQVGTAYFTIPHFDGYPAILMRLAEVGPDELEELVTDAWLVRAPKRLAKSFLDSLGNSAP